MRATGPARRSRAIPVPAGLLHAVSRRGRVDRVGDQPLHLPSRQVVRHHLRLIGEERHRRGRCGSSSQRAAPRKSHRLPSRYCEISVGAPVGEDHDATAAESSHRGRSARLDPDQSIQEDTGADEQGRHGGDQIEGRHRGPHLNQQIKPGERRAGMPSGGPAAGCAPATTACRCPGRPPARAAA